MNLTAYKGYSIAFIGGYRTALVFYHNCALFRVMTLSQDSRYSQSLGLSAYQFLDERLLGVALQV